MELRENTISDCLLPNPIKPRSQWTQTTSSRARFNIPDANHWSTLFHVQTRAATPSNIHAHSDKKKQQPMRAAFASPRLTILICPSCIINPVALAGAIDRERAAGVAGQKAPRPVFRPHPPSPLKYLNPKQSQTITMS